MIHHVHAEKILLSAISYFALILGLWTIYVLTLYPFVIGVEILPARIFLNELIRVLIFVAPVFFILKYIVGENPFSFLKLGCNVKIGFLWGIGAALIYAALVLGRFLVVKGSVHPKAVSIEAWFTAIIVATIIEEIAFRGFLLQAFAREMKFWAANVLTATLFVAIHLPGWIILADAPIVPNKLTAMAEILFLGLLLGFLFKRSGSLWACVILHATNNLLSTILFG